MLLYEQPLRRWQQKYHPDKLKAGSVQGAHLMVDINLSYKDLKQPHPRGKKYDQALNEALGQNKQPNHMSSPSGQRPEFHPAGKRHDPDFKKPSQFNAQTTSSHHTQPPEHEFAKLISRIKANAVDEIELVNLFEKLFKRPLTIRHGYSNTYLFEENEQALHP
jgi:DnaJ-class molecular chaperone